jgi:hypothetical protein
MKRFLVVGLGNFGSTLAERLHERGHDVAALDTREDLVDALGPKVSRALVGDGTNRRVLQEAGAEQTDAAIISTGDNLAASVLSLLALRDLERRAGGGLLAAQRRRQHEEGEAALHGASLMRERGCGHTRHYAPRVPVRAPDHAERERGATYANARRRSRCAAHRSRRTACTFSAEQSRVRMRWNARCFGGRDPVAPPPPPPPPPASRALQGGCP